MAFTTISIPADTLQAQLEAVCAGLLYPSESDFPISVLRFPQETIGERFSEADLLRLFYADVPAPLPVEWAMMERVDAVGYQRFFRHYIDLISQTPGGDGITVWEPAHRERALSFQALRDLWMNHLIHQRWFKVALPDGANKAVYIAGQLLDIAIDEQTNETLTTPSDWFVLATGVVET